MLCHEIESFFIAPISRKNNLVLGLYQNIFMKKTFTLIALAFSFITTQAQTNPTWVWGKLNANAPSNINPEFTKQAVASSGDKVLWSVILNQKAILNEQLGDYRFAEYDTSGATLNTTTVTGKLSVVKTQSDQSGNWYILAKYEDTLTFLNGTQFAKPLGGSDFCLFKLNASSLSLGWIKTVGADFFTSTSSFTIANNKLFLAVDSADANSIYELNLATGASSLKLAQQGGSYITSIQVDAVGNIYMSGSCAFNAMNFNGHQIPTPSSFSYPQYIVKYKANGSYDWSYFSNDVTCTNRRLSLTDDNTLYYSGAVLDSFHLGTLIIHPPKQFSAFFISRLDSLGNFLWAKQSADSAFCTANTAGGNHAAITKNGNLALLIQSSGYNDWGNGFSTYSTFNEFYSTVVIYDKNGNTLSAKQVKADYVVPQHIAASNNNIWITGNATDSSKVVFDAITANVPTTGFAYYPIVGRLRLHSATTAVASIIKEHEFNLIPNPATTKISISTSRHTNLINVKLIDNVGRMIGNYEVAQKQEIDLISFSKGLYFAHITDGTYQEVIKFVVE